MNTMHKDLELFISLANELLEKEVEEPVVEPIDPDQLYEQLDLSLTDEPLMDQAFIHSLRQLVLSTPRTASKKFYNQLFGGRNSKAVLGDLIAVMLNNSMYTYKVAGPQVGVEKEIIHKSCDLVGYPSSSGWYHCRWWFHDQSHGYAHG